MDDEQFLNAYRVVFILIITAFFILFVWMWAPAINAKFVKNMNENMRNVNFVRCVNNNADSSVNNGVDSSVDNGADSSVDSNKNNAVNTNNKNTKKITDDDIEQKQKKLLDSILQ